MIQRAPGILAALDLDHQIVFRDGPNQLCARSRQARS
jgi:hypothetical protein